MLGNGIQIGDLVDVAIFKLAKLRRKNLEGDTRDFYEEFFTPNDDAVLRSGLDRRRTYRAAVLRSAVLARVPYGGVVLDVGAGVGDNLRAIAREGLQLFGIEYAAASVRLAKEVLPGSIFMLQGSGTELPFASGQFDVVVCIEVLEHIDDHHQVLREIRRVLKPAGKLILSVPYRRWFPSYYTQMGHYRHYTRSGLAAILNGVGFAITEYLPNYPKWSRRANYCYVACRIAALALRAFGKHRFPHEVQVPFTKKRLIDCLFDWIEPTRLIEESADYAEMETSTFVCCELTALRRFRARAVSGWYGGACE